MERWRGSCVQALLDDAIGSQTLPCQGTGPLFDFHQTLVGTVTESQTAKTHPATICKLARQNDVLPSAVLASRVPAHDKDNLMPSVDSHSLGSRRGWLPIDEKPHSARMLHAERAARRWEKLCMREDACTMSRLPRSERIKLLEDLDATWKPERNDNLKKLDAGRKHLEDMPGICISSRRAYRERQIRGNTDVGVLSPEEVNPKATDSSSSRPLHIKTALLLDKCDEVVDDGFSKAVDKYRNALTCTALIPQPESKEPSQIVTSKDSDAPSLSNRQEYPRLSPGSRQRRALRYRLSPSEEVPSITGVQGWLSDFTEALAEQSCSSGEVSLGKAELFVKLSAHLQTRAYVLRPEDSLKALTLISRSVDLLDLRERRTQYDVETYEIDSSLAKACISVREAMEQILAALVGRIPSAEAPYLAEAMFTMAETHAGRQEFLDAMLAHMLWLLAAKPRTFTPCVIARIMWALGRMQVEKGADGTKLCVLATDTNKRAIDALQARLVQVLDTFLEDDIGTLALDPTGGDLLGDAELRRVLHRAGSLQVGLRFESQKFKEALQRLVARAQARLFLPYQAEIMPHMRDYCEKLVSSSSR